MFDTRFDELTFTVFDTETTGMSPDKGAKLLEIGAVKVKPGSSSTFRTLIIHSLIQKPISHTMPMPCMG